MCQVCAPFCGKCKPPMEKPVRCPVCGVFNIPQNRECKKCGTAMPERITPKAKPTMCQYTKTICPNPCSLSSIVSKNGISMRCAKDRKLKRVNLTPE